MNISILGAGKIATAMATTLQPLKGVTCYAVASRNMNKAQVFADKYGFAKAYGSYTDMLDDPEVELVYIATPHSHHYEHIKMCLEHNKHVLCEKAFTANARQAEEVLRLAEEKGLLLTEAMWTRYMPMRQKIVDVINSGVIGTPTSLACNLGYSIEHVDRITNPYLCGGALLDLGVYVLNFAAMIFGNDITAMTANCVKYKTGVDAQETIMLSYADGKMASLYVTFLAQTDRRGFINGTNGYIEIENINNFESIRVYNLERKVVAEYAAPTQVTGYEYEVQSAIKAIENHEIECPEMTHYDTLLMMQLMDNIRAAWGIKYPYSVERTDDDPEEDPVITARRIEQEKRAEEARKRKEEAEKRRAEAEKERQKNEDERLRIIEERAKVAKEKAEKVAKDSSKEEKSSTEKDSSVEKTATKSGEDDKVESKSESKEEDVVKVKINKMF